MSKLLGSKLIITNNETGVKTYKKDEYEISRLQKPQARN